MVDLGMKITGYATINHIKDFQNQDREALVLSYARGPQEVAVEIDLEKYEVKTGNNPHCFIVKRKE